MIPRDYQNAAVAAARDRLAAQGNTLLVLPTGAGKTAVAGFCISEELEHRPQDRVLVLQHTDELIDQNRSAIGAITGLPTSVVKAEQDNWDGRIVFGSVQTLARANRRSRMVPCSHLVIDECHRVASTSYQAVVDEARTLNPNVKLLGLSATPSRGDGRSLRTTFDNVGYQIRIGALIAQGLLVPPQTFIIDLGIGDELADLDATAGDYDMRAADQVLNRSVLTDAVVEHWEDKAGDRQTIFFCATVTHARAVAEAFCAADHAAEMISGDMPAKDRAEAIARFDRGETRILTNCMVLTEGFDSQPVGCIGILRPMLHKGTFIQAVGRGLRRVDPLRYPRVVKTNCIVLDFAGAALRHGSLEQEIDLDIEDPVPGEAPWKHCPCCAATLPLSARICDFCGHEFVRERIALETFEMREIDLLDTSPFAWVPLRNDGSALMASGFEGWAGVFYDGTLWHALGRPKARPVQPLAIGTRVQALAAADDFLRATETGTAAIKSRRWHSDPASQRQIASLARAGHQADGLDFGLSKYAANCHLNYLWNRDAIVRSVLGAASRVAA